MSTMVVVGNRTVSDLGFLLLPLYFLGFHNRDVFLLNSRGIRVRARACAYVCMYVRVRVFPPILA